MNLVELYQQTPVEKHPEIVVAGDRLFFDGEEYLVLADGDLKLVRSEKELLLRMDQISGELGAGL